MHRHLFSLHDKSHLQRFFLGYAFAVVAVGLALAITYTTWPAFQHTPWILFFGAVVISTLYGNYGPGWFAVVLSALAGNYFFIGDPTAFDFDKQSLFTTLTFILAGSVGVLMASSRMRTYRLNYQQKQQLEETDKRFEVLLTATSMIIYRMSPDWKEMQSLVGREFIADTLEPSQTWLSKYIPSDSHQQVLASIQEAIDKKIIFQLEHRIIRADGSIGWIFSRAVPVLDTNGNIVEWFGAASDVTQRKQAEEEHARAVAESDKMRRLYETALSNTPDLVYIFDLNHRFIYANQALLHMWGRSWKDAIGKNCLELGYEPWHAAMHDREIEQVVATKKPIRGEVPFTGTSGRRVYDYIFAPVIGEDGKVVAVAGVTRDVTERQQAEITLRENDRRKDEFLAMLAHELRNPLSSISNSIQLLKMPKIPAEYANSSKNIIERQVKHLSRMIEDLLDVSRITRGKIELRKQIIEISPAIQSAIDSIEPQLHDKNQQLTVSLATGELWCEADPTRLEQILINLLTNASRYTPAGGRIELSAENLGKHLLFRVKDNGIGIASDQLGQIFELFAQGNRTIARSEGGLGIGLTIVKRLVELHRGSVDVYSAGIGLGSEFTVTLPATQKPHDISSETKISEISDIRPLRILLVDDNVDSAESLTKLLTLRGHQIYVGHDGKQAIAAALQHRPDTIILDIGLPGMDGYEAAESLRKQPTLTNTVFIAVTGYGQEQDRQKAFDAGFHYHLVKPLDYSRLDEILRAISTSQARPAV